MGRRIVFGEDAARRVASATKRVESQPYDFTGQGKGPRNWTPGILEARVTTAITQATSTDYGIGTAMVQIEDPGNPGKYIDDPTYGDVDVLNYSKTSGTVGIGVHILIGWRNGKFLLVSRDCP